MYRCFLAAALVLQAVPALAQDRTVEATAVDVEPDLIYCGHLAVAGWVTFRVDHQVAGRRLASGSLIRVIVQCPTHIVRNGAYRLVITGRRPTTDGWEMFSQRGALPSDGLPTYW